MSTNEQQERHQRKVRKIRDIQLSPARSLPMTMFMMWMAGNDIQIFSIMITGMAIYQPLGALMQTNTVFQMFAGDAQLKSDLFLGKLIYAACCLVGLAFGLVKLSYMGLLPTSSMDWMDHSPPTYTEISQRITDLL